MSVHDTIGDFITVIRNAGQAGKDSCSYPHSNLRAGIAKILKDRGFVHDCLEGDNDKGFKTLEIKLKYVSGKHAIKGISRVSTPGSPFLLWLQRNPKCFGRVGNFYNQFAQRDH